MITSYIDLLYMLWFEHMTYGSESERATHYITAPHSAPTPELYGLRNIHRLLVVPLIDNWYCNNVELCLWWVCVSYYTQRVDNKTVDDSFIYLFRMYL